MDTSRNIMCFLNIEVRKHFLIDTQNRSMNLNGNYMGHLRQISFFCLDQCKFVACLPVQER